MGGAQLIRNHQEPQPFLVADTVLHSTSPLDVPKPHLSHSDNKGHLRNKGCYTLVYDVSPIGLPIW